MIRWFFFLFALNIAVTAQAVVSVSPQTGCTGTTQTFQFTAIVTGTNNTAVNWYVDKKLGGSSTVGTITTGGLYTAPASAGTHTVKAVSVSQPTWNSTSTITVVSAVKVTMAVGTAAVLAGNTQQFSAAVCGATDPSLTWSATGGTVDSTGFYTAPANSGTYTVKATSVADPSKSASVTVTVFSQIAADFGSRSGGVNIPAGIFAANYVERLPASVITLFANAGFSGGRTFARMNDVYATTTPNWAPIDKAVAKYANAGLSPLIVMAYSPPWLLPANPCSTSAPPTDINQWAQLAASYVAHFDQKFPGVVVDYEIWNEPSHTICGVSDQLTFYLNMYAAAGAAMRNQATADGQTIRIGGPAGFGNWISALVTNSATAPYVDWVSYHKYGYGNTEINLGLNWDSSTSTVPLYPRTQDPVNGWPAEFQRVQSAAKGKPVYVTEYNDSASFRVTCCRNNPTYGPLWNSLLVADLLNTVYSGSARVPSRLEYYAAGGGTVNLGYFCLYGTFDANMDCAVSGGYAPYPQTYAYALLASSSYLNLENGGNMAASVSPPTTQLGLVPTAFSTATEDVVFIVNPTPTDYPSLNVLLNNPGLTPSYGTYYLLNSSNPQINIQPLSLSPVGGGYTASVSVPAYSVVAVSIHP